MTSTLIEKVDHAAALEPSERDAADIRLLISQGQQLPQCVPAALKILEDNPLVGVEFFSGDLLKAVLQINQSYWFTHQDQWQTVHSILASIDEALHATEQARSAFLRME